MWIDVDGRVGGCSYGELSRSPDWSRADRPSTDHQNLPRLERPEGSNSPQASNALPVVRLHLLRSHQLLPRLAATSSTEVCSMSSPSAQHEGENANQPTKLEPRCLASTAVCSNGLNTPDSASETHSKYENNFFKEAQMSTDGSTIVSHNDDRNLRTFVLPENLQGEGDQPHGLAPCALLPSPTNIQSYALYPGFNQDDETSTLVLSASSDLPIRLTNVLKPENTPITYPFIHTKTEKYQAPNSLAWHPYGTHFIAGAKGTIAIFDATRDASGPIATHINNPRNPQTAVSSMRDSGLIMSLGISPEGYLAAGSSNRTVGIFSSFGHGPCETSFSVASTPGDPDASTYSGTGITSISWTRDGTYLLAAERQSNGIHVYDVRNQLRRVAWLSNRNALTPQRLGISTVPVMSGLEVWAGGKDGGVRMWRNPGRREGTQEPDEVFAGLHGDPIASAVWHPGGTVMATCSGQRRFGGLDEDDGAPADNSLKVWGV